MLILILSYGWWKNQTLEFSSIKRKNLYTWILGNYLVIFKQESSRKQHHKPSNQPHEGEHRLRTHDDYFPILFGQYHIWDIFGLVLKSKVICRKNKWMNKIMDKGLTVSKMGTHALAKNTPNTTPKLIWLICPISPKV